MKILLLNPPAKDNKLFIREGRCTQEQGVWSTLWPPLSLASIGAVLEQDGNTVKIIDCAAESVRWEALDKYLQNFSPEVVIWSTATPTINNDLALSSIIKRNNYKTYTAVFGTHVTVLDRQCMEQFPDIDFIIRNEPENTTAELIRALRYKKSLETVYGLTFRADTKTIIRNPSVPYIENLDTLPIPAWHLVNLDCYRLPIKSEKYLMIAPQRGCPFNCSFCTCQTYYGNKLRKRSTLSVLKEIKHGVEKFGIHDFFFWAETFILDKDFVRDLCNAILKEGLQISWTCNSRVDTVDASLLKLMAHAGCWMISLGIESSDQNILNECGKKTYVHQAHDAVKYARQAGIITVGHFILGLPGETVHSIKRTITFSKQLGLDLAQFYCAVPFPGSNLYKRAVKEGWIENAHFSNFKQDCAVMELPTISADQVNKYRSAAYRSFYLNIGAICRTAKLVNWKNFIKTWNNALEFLRWMQK